MDVDEPSRNKSLCPMISNGYVEIKYLVDELKRRRSRLMFSEVNNSNRARITYNRIEFTDYNNKELKQKFQPSYAEVINENESYLAKTR